MTQESEPNTWPGAIATITLFVEDLEATQDFYTKVFGAPIVFTDEDCSVFQFPNMLVNLLKSSAGAELLEPEVVASREAGSRFVFTTNVDDVDAMCATLAARGVTLLNGPMDRPWGIRTASFVDPGGYVWEIAKRRPS